MTGAGRPVVVIEQDLPLRGTGLVGRLLARRGMPVRPVRAWEDAVGDVDPRDAAAIIALGGTQHAWDVESHPFLADERRLLLAAHEQDVPVLGICLGGQVLALALGAEVGPADEPERGLYDIELLPAAADDPVFGPAAGPRPSVYQWHLDAFGLPEGATLLARSPAAPVQAFRLGRSWGLQFHPEVDDALLTSWLASFPTACADAGVDEPGLRAEFRRRESAPFASFAARLIDAFLDLVGAREGTQRDRA